METSTVKIDELNKDVLGGREQIRANSKAASEEFVQIALEKIVIREGFNVRTDYGDLDGLATSILENGQQLPGRVDVLEDGTFVLTDGHRRYEALKLLVERGFESPMFKAIVNNKKTTEEQRILQMFVSQDNKQLTPHETAELFARLRNIGYKVKDIAAKVGKTQPYVSQMLEYASESPEIKEEVRKGNITVGAVAKIRKELPSTADRVSAVKVAVAGKGDKKKVSARQVTGRSEEQKLAKKITTAVFKYMDGVQELDREEMFDAILACL